MQGKSLADIERRRLRPWQLRCEHGGNATQSRGFSRMPAMAVACEESSGAVATEMCTVHVAGSCPDSGSHWISAT
jgi:hypothetical protein